MPRTIRNRVRRESLVTALNAMSERRHRELEADPMFVQGNDALLRHLAKAYAQNPEVVTHFFDQFSWPTASKLKDLNAFFREMQNPVLEKTLWQYVKHANRFRVVFVLRKRPPHFEIVEYLPGAAKFHVRIAEGQLTPISPLADEDDPIDISFESEKLKVPKSLTKPINRGLAKFVLIDDEEGSSCLSVLEHVAYFPEGITFVLHRAEQPYLLCLIGEKVSAELWRKLNTTVTEMLRGNFGRAKAGRPKDLKKLKQAKRLLKSPGSLKDKAFRLGGK